MRSPYFSSSAVLRIGAQNTHPLPLTVKELNDRCECQDPQGWKRFAVAVSFTALRLGRSVTGGRLIIRPGARARSRSARRAGPEGYARSVIVSWDPAMAGVLRLPSGRLVRGRGLRRPLPEGPAPTFALHLLGHEPPLVAWEARWLRWPDFWLPSDRAAAGGGAARGMGACRNRARRDRLRRRPRTDRHRAGLPSRTGRGAGPPRRSPMSGSTTRHAPWRPPGNGASSPVSSSDSPRHTAASSHRAGPANLPGHGRRRGDSNGSSGHDQAILRGWENRGL